MKKQTWTFLLLLISAPLAADLIIDTPLSFGEIAISNNNSVSTLIVYRNGAYKSTNHIFILKPGTPGVFTLTGLTPFANLNISADLPATSAMPFPNTAQFSITAVDMPTAVNTGAGGNAQFKVGATLSSSGNPAQNYYSGATYTIYLNINLSY